MLQCIASLMKFIMLMDQLHSSCEEIDTVTQSDAQPSKDRDFDQSLMSRERSATESYTLYGT